MRRTAHFFMDALPACRARVPRDGHHTHPPSEPSPPRAAGSNWWRRPVRWRPCAWPCSTARTPSTLGLRDATNARNFGGLNFSEDDIRTGVAEARARGAEVLFAINTFAQMGQVDRWHRAVDAAAALGADAVIMADPGLMAYAADKHPDLRLHLSVQGLGHSMPMPSR